MSTEANRAVVRELFEAVERGVDGFLAVRAEHFDRGLRSHFAGMPVLDLDGHEQLTRQMFAAFPDMRQPIEDLVAEGDTVVARFMSYGTHRGPMWGIPPTGRAASCEGITIFRLSGGKVAEQWTELDLFGLMQQLGAIPSPGQGAAAPGQHTAAPGNPVAESRASGEQELSTEQAKDMVRRYLEATINEGDAAAIDGFTAADYVGHMSGVPAFDRAMHRQLLAAFRSAFPDQRIAIEELIAGGDRVVNRSTYTGTHLGEFQGIPPTGKRFTITGINISRFANGRIVEDWTVLDMLGMLQQLGVIPAPTAV